MKTYIHLTMSQNHCLPDVFQGDDVRYPESLVEFFLEQFTQKGYVVFDPFAGYGTTLLVAERMGRVPFGVEINQDRVNFARSKLSNPENLIRGDARVLANIDLPEIDFSIASPPYMSRDDHPEFPFAGRLSLSLGERAVRPSEAAGPEEGHGSRPSQPFETLTSFVPQGQRASRVAEEGGKADCLEAHGGCPSQPFETLTSFVPQGERRGSTCLKPV